MFWARLRRSGAAGHAATVAAVALACFGAARLGLALAHDASTASAVWPPAGIAIATLVVFGIRYWPA